VLGGKTDVETRPTTSEPHPKDTKRVQSEGILGAILGKFARNLAKNAGVDDPKVINAFAQHFNRKRPKPKKPVAAKAKKQKSVVNTSPKTKEPESKPVHEPGEKMSRQELAKKLKMSGNDLKAIR
jgi:hypothetical protein